MLGKGMPGGGGGQERGVEKKGRKERGKEGR